MRIKWQVSGRYNLLLGDDVFQVIENNNAP